MTENLPAITTQEIALVHQSLTEGKVSDAMNHFRKVALSAPLPALYSVYCNVKHEMTNLDEDTRKKFNVFNDLFLRMLEERGETDHDIYMMLLRDSSEYRYLNTLFGDKQAKVKKEKPEVVAALIPEVKEDPPVLPALKKIISAKYISLIEFDIDTWYDLVHDHLADIKDETMFVKKCAQVINYVEPVPEREVFHLELVIVYAFERLAGYRTLTTKTKDFAMQAMNLMTEREPLWSKLHKQFLVLIKK